MWSGCLRLLDSGIKIGGGMGMPVYETNKQTNTWPIPGSRL